MKPSFIVAAAFAFAASLASASPLPQINAPPADYPVLDTPQQPQQQQGDVTIKAAGQPATQAPSPSETGAVTVASASMTLVVGGIETIAVGQTVQPQATQAPPGGNAGAGGIEVLTSVAPGPVPTTQVTQQATTTQQQPPPPQQTQQPPQQTTVTAAPTTTVIVATQNVPPPPGGTTIGAGGNGVRTVTFGRAADEASQTIGLTVLQNPVVQATIAPGNPQVTAQGTQSGQTILTTLAPPATATGVATQVGGQVTQVTQVTQGTQVTQQGTQTTRAQTTTRGAEPTNGGNQGGKNQGGNKGGNNGGQKTTAGQPQQTTGTQATSATQVTQTTPSATVTSATPAPTTPPPNGGNGGNQQGGKGRLIELAQPLSLTGLTTTAKSLSPNFKLGTFLLDFVSLLQQGASPTDIGTFREAMRRSDINASNDQLAAAVKSLGADGNGQLETTGRALGEFAKEMKAQNVDFAKAGAELETKGVQEALAALGL